MEGTAVERPPYLWALATFVVIFAIYCLTLSPTIAFWDTAEYIAAAKVLGIPHPPGNPLFTLLAHVWGLLPLSADYAKRINYFAAATSAAGAAFWFLIAERWLRVLLPARGLRLASAFAGIFASAMAWTVWNQSTVNEKVYTVSLLSIAIVVWCAVYWADQPRGPRRDRWIILGIYLSMLSSTNHQMGILGLPVVGWYVLSDDWSVLLRWRVWLAIAAGTYLIVGNPWHTALGDLTNTKLWGPILLSAAAAIYAIFTDADMKSRLPAISAALFVGILGITLHHIYLPMRAAQYPPINEGEPIGGQALRDNLDRVQYAKPGVFPRQPWAEGMPIQNAKNLGAQLANYWEYWTWQWGRDLGKLRGAAVGLFTALGLAGLLAMIRSRWRDGLAAAGLLVTLTFLLIFYLNFKYGFSYHVGDPSITNDMREVRERDYFFIGSFAYVGVFFAAGFAMLIRGIGDWLGDRVPEEKRLMAGSPVLLLALVPLFGNRITAPRSSETLARDFAVDMLESLEPYGILITAGDNDTFPLWYAQEVMGVRRDVTLANLSLMNTDWHLRQIRRRPEEAFDPSTADPFWRPGTDSANQRLGLAPQTDWVRPTTPVMAESEATLNTLPEISRTPENPHARVGSLELTFGRSYLEKADLAAIIMLRDNLGKRPIYFSWSDSDYPDERLGLSPYLVSHGLVRKVMPDSVKAGGSIVLTDNLGYVDMERTRNLVFNVYHPEGAMRERPRGWVDVPSSTILQLYALTYLSAAQLFSQHGDPALGARADTIGRKVLKNYPGAGN